MPKLKRIDVNTFKNRQRYAKTQSPSFKGVSSATSEVIAAATKEIQSGIQQIFKTEQAGKEIVGFMPKSLNFLERFNNMQGELANNIITAIGTGIVAPIFIAFNPISKTKKEDKQYAALRQPVSAAITILSQLAVLIPFNRTVTYLTNNGQLGENYSTSLIQEEGYLKSSIKAAKPHLTKEQLAQEVLDTRVRQYTDAINTILREGTIVQDRKPLAREKFKELLTSVHDSLSKNINKEISRYKDNQLISKIQRLNYYKFNYSEADTLLSSIDAKINAGENFDSVKKYLKQLLKEARKNSTKSDAYEHLLADLASKLNKQGLQAQVVHIRNELESVKEAVQKKQFDELVKNVEQKVAEKIGKLRTQQGILTEIRDIINSDEDSRTIARKIFDKAKSLDGENFFYEVVNKHAKNASKRIKGYKNLIGLAMSLALLPLTCTFLNWAYPRFVEKCLPHLAKPSQCNEKGGK